MRSRQELARDQRAQVVVLANKFTNELMEPALKNPIHTAVLQSRTYSTRLTLGRPWSIVGAGE